jgi:hypothetical protein
LSINIHSQKPIRQKIIKSEGPELRETKQNHKPHDQAEKKKKEKLDQALNCEHCELQRMT